MQYHQSVLKLHTKRAAYQGEIIWGEANLPRPVTKRPVDWGWSRQDGMWKIHRTDIPSSCKLSRTDQMWLQEGLLWEVQMSSLWAELYSFV